MTLRSLLAAALVAVAASTSWAAIGDCAWAPAPPHSPTDFPRPMPGLVDTLDGSWQSLRDIMRPKLGLSPIDPIVLH